MTNVTFEFNLRMPNFSRVFHTKSNGFTLVELMVAIAVIGILVSVSIIGIPNIQKRARDSQRLSDLRQLQSILEKEINSEAKAYPVSDENSQIKDHPWGSVWQKHNYYVPKDPLPTQSYVYISDGEKYQLYAKFEDIKSFPAFACSNPCGPGGDFNAGIAGGEGSALISWNTESGGTGVGGGQGGTGTEEEKPFFPIAQGDQTYTVEGTGKPQLVSVSINPHDPMVGSSQTIKARIRDTDPVTSVTISIKSDNSQNSYPLDRTAGTDLDGEWSGSWVVVDTHARSYVISVRATDAGGSTDKYDLTIR